MRTSTRGSKELNMAAYRQRGGAIMRQIKRTMAGTGIELPLSGTR
jgi:hypothetical protein